MDDSDKDLVEVVDEQDNIVEVIARGLSESRNDIIRNVIIFIFNSKGQVLLQKRAMTKKHYPGFLDPTAAGAIAPGESPDTAAKRELHEEASLDCNITFITKFLNVFPDETNTIVRKRWTSMYYGICDDEPKANEEVESFEWWDIDALARKTQANPELFVPSFDVEFNYAYKAYQARKN